MSRSATKGPSDLHGQQQVNLGSNTTAHIRTGTLLGRRVLTLESDGEGRRSTGVIGVAHRIARFSLTDALGVRRAPATPTPRYPTSR